MLHICYASTWEVGTERSGAHGHLCLHREFEISPGYMRPCLINNEQNKKYKILQMKERLLLLDPFLLKQLGRNSVWSHVDCGLYVWYFRVLVALHALLKCASVCMYIFCNLVTFALMRVFIHLNCVRPSSCAWKLLFTSPAVRRKRGAGSVLAHVSWGTGMSRFFKSSTSQWK